MTVTPPHRTCRSRRHIHEVSRVAMGAMLLAALCLGTPGFSATPGGGGLRATLAGTVTLLWGDGPSPASGGTGPLVFLTDDSGARVRLVLDDATFSFPGGVLALNGRRVIAGGTWSEAPAPSGGRQVLLVDRLDPAGGEAPGALEAVSGSQPWVSVLCKFADVAAEPRNLAYFQDMFADTYPGLDHYWREVSFDNINVAGSLARGWYDLPQPRSYYVDASGNADLNRLFDDCTAVADADIYYPGFVGINLMFNDDIGPYAWGGSHWANLDGVSGIWRVTWEPPWGYANVTVMSHEMGHGFGLPHSSFNPASVYDNAWDVMSDTWSYTISDPVYGKVGQHTIGYHVDDLLGTLRPPESVTVSAGGSATVDLERMARPQTPAPKVIRIPIAGSATNFYTVESRVRVGYDRGLPGSAVIVHEVETSRQQPALVQGTNGASGAMLLPGDVFRDSANGIGVAVVSTLDTGWRVAVANGSAMAASSPEVDVAATGGTSSNVNGILEPGERVLFSPSWTNASNSTVTASGTLTGFTGPAGATYTVADGAASYGAAAPAATRNCRNTGDCYELQVSSPATRPATHWDTLVTETLASGATKSWKIHVGSSFSDVPPTRWGYRHIESLLHSGITAGCSASDYCPAAGITRWQMAVFLAKALTGGNIPTSGTVEGLGDYNCVAGGTSLFSDVAPDNSGCRHIHYIAAKKITAGCGGGKFCPGGVVNRWQMAVFLAKAMAGIFVEDSGTVPGTGAYDCTAGGSSIFSDVPVTDPGCRFIHFLAAQGVTAGCGGGNYCPGDPLRRDQMAVFMTKAFDLQVAD